MKRIVTGIFAHVDSGKTTLSEALLFNAGAIRNRGRVDLKDTHLDTNIIERERGITIFSKQAVLKSGETHITLLDTPGHIDFSAEAERTLSVLDYAILVISAPEGVQSHSKTLFGALKDYGIPVFIFINKMDMSQKSKKELLSTLRENFGASCIDYSDLSPETTEEKALCSDALTEEYLETGKISLESEKQAIFERKIFPCYFGSALKDKGTKEILEALDKYTLDLKAAEVFGGKVFKIAEDEKGQRLTFLKVTGGKLLVKSLIGDEKINEIRIYSGSKFESVQEASFGEVCAVCGPIKTYPGQGLGFEEDSRPLSFAPVFLYKVSFPESVDITAAFSALKKLEEEDSNLSVSYNETLKEIHLRLMGEIQAQVLKRIIRDRFNLEAEFLKGGIVYKETLAESSYGAGHYEPLRHYAEVHLKLEPLKAGEGIEILSECREDDLDKNWQKLILTHLKEKEHKGVLCGFPLTDIKITLVAGKAHIKHTEGGDFRQATYRALRQGLMCAKSKILEPWFNFSLTLPSENLGRAMTDIQNMGGEYSAPEIENGFAYLSGSAPAAKISDYPEELTAYSHGGGRISLKNGGYRPCTPEEEEKIIDAQSYDAEEDKDNPADSVFCTKGAGFVVKWDKVWDYMHLEKKTGKPAYNPIAQTSQFSKKATFGDEAELIKIFENTYGKIKPRELPKEARLKGTAPTFKYKESEIKTKNNKHKEKSRSNEAKDRYLLIDGYNILFALYNLENASAEDLDFGRNYFLTRLSNFAALTGEKIIVVFDAYKVKGGLGSVEKAGNINVVYTKEAETADSYIEKVATEISKKHSARVATSDRAEQLIIFSGGAFRVSAAEFLKELEEAEKNLSEMIKEKELSSIGIGRIAKEKFEKINNPE